MGLRRRASTIFLIPFAIFIFMIGWGLIRIERHQDRGNVETPQNRKPIVAEDSTTDECVEVGIIEDLMECVLNE